MIDDATQAADGGSLSALDRARELLSAVVPDGSTTVMLDQIRALRELGSVLAAAEATVTAAFVTARRAEQTATGMSKRRVGQGIPQELGRARRESPSRAGRYAGYACALTRELPATFAALRAGETTEWRAMLLARETGWLTLANRLSVDADLGPRLVGLGDRDVEAQAQKLAYAADPQGKVRQINRAAGGRHVSLRPAPDGQCRMNATLPLKEGVAAYAALSRAADAARAAGDERGRGQVMADTLVERITGQTRATDVGITVDVIITDQALFNTGPRADEPATVSGHGPVPAPWARDLIHQTATAATAGSAAARGAAVRIRRLFTDPAGRLVTMETASREFTPAMAAFIKLRDQWCSTPYCGAPIRHTDHHLPWAQGGPTSLENARGLCEACNYAKQAPGWQTRQNTDGTITTTMPTGHDADSFSKPRAPDPAPPSRLERAQRRRLSRSGGCLRGTPVDMIQPPARLAIRYTHGSHE